MYWLGPICCCSSVGTRRHEQTDVVAAVTGGSSKMYGVQRERAVKAGVGRIYVGPLLAETALSLRISTKTNRFICKLR